MLTEQQKKAFQKDGILPSNAHDTYILACENQAFRRHPKFHSDKKPQNFGGKNITNPV